jgi:ribonuclease D
MEMLNALALEQVKYAALDAWVLLPLHAARRAN